MTLPLGELWPRCLEQLRLQMSKATFETWLQKTTARLEDNRLIIETDSTFALDWLENRLRDHIERCVEKVAGRRLRIEFVLRPNGQQPDLFFKGTYHDAINAITEPNRLHYCSRYFHLKWLPLLGPERWLLIFVMRTHCYWNRETGVKRDTFEATLDELGAAMGMDRTKVWRLLNPADKTLRAYMDKFILRKETRRRYSNNRGRMVNDTTFFQIRLDDPLTPEDEKRYQEMTQGMPPEGK